MRTKNFLIYDLPEGVRVKDSKLAGYELTDGTLVFFFKIKRSQAKHQDFNKFIQMKQHKKAETL